MTLAYAWILYTPMRLAFPHVITHVEVPRDDIVVRAVPWHVRRSWPRKAQRRYARAIGGAR